jgi:tRNA pseudouridine38-40 synthase
MLIAYDGTGYHGWQLQPQAPTVQGELEGALGRMAKRPVRVTGAGRTDAGVHAKGQVAHFDLNHPIPTEGMVKGLNTLIPPDIRVLEVEEVEEDFHARYSARSKTYRYYLDLSPVASPFRCRFTLHHPYDLDRDAMREAASEFIGEHDFAAFRAASCRAKTTSRAVSQSEWVEAGKELVYQVRATGFLHHMVRNLVGTMLEVGRNKMSPCNVRTILDSRDRNLAGPTAPPEGLHLERVEYDESSTE